MRLVKIYYGNKQITSGFLGTKRIDLEYVRLVVYAQEEAISYEGIVKLATPQGYVLQGQVSIGEFEHFIEVLPAEGEKPKIVEGNDSDGVVEVGILFVIDIGSEKSITAEIEGSVNIITPFANLIEAKEETLLTELVSPISATGALPNVKDCDDFNEIVNPIDARGETPEIIEENIIVDEIKVILSQTNTAKVNVENIFSEEAKTIPASGALAQTQLFEEVEAEPIQVYSKAPIMVERTKCEINLIEENAEINQYNAQTFVGGEIDTNILTEEAEVQIIQVITPHVEDNNSFLENALQMTNAIANNCSGFLDNEMQTVIDAKIWPRWFYMDGSKLVILQSFNFNQSGTKLIIN